MHYIGYDGKLIRSCCHGGMEAAQGIDSCGQEEDAAEHAVDRMEMEVESGCNPEVPTSTPDGPEQIRVVFSIYKQMLTVRRHEFGSQQLVDRQSVLARQKAYAAAEGDSTDPHAGSVAESGGEAMIRRGKGVFSSCEAGPGPCGARCCVDLNGFQVAQVQYDAAIDDAVTGDIVASAADREPQVMITRVSHNVGHVVRIRGSDDDGGSAVHPPVEDLSCSVKIRIPREDDPSTERSLQPLQRGLFVQRARRFDVVDQLCPPLVSMGKNYCFEVYGEVG